MAEKNKPAVFDPGDLLNQISAKADHLEHRMSDLEESYSALLKRVGQGIQQPDRVDMTELLEKMNILRADLDSVIAAGRPTASPETPTVPPSGDPGAKPK